MAGQYFFIKSRLSGLVMDVEGGNREPGTPVILWEKKDHDVSNTNQLFYEDSSSRSIRSALNDLCLSMNSDNELVLNHYNNSSVQRWERDGDRIRNCDDSQVLDVSGECSDPGAKMCKWDDHGGINQQWDFEYIHGSGPGGHHPQAGGYHSHHGGPPQHHVHRGETSRPPSPDMSSSSSSSSSSSGEDENEDESEPQYFYIRSGMHGKVLDVSGADRSEGAEVIVWPRNDEPSDNQLWYVTGDRAIRSKMNGFTLDSRDGDLKLYPHQEYSETQGFQIEGDHIVNKHDGKCVDINGACEDDGTHVCSWEHHDGDNQRWQIDNA